MNHYQITAQVQVPFGRSFEGFDQCELFAKDVSDALERQGWGGGGGMCSDGSVVSIQFYIRGDHLPEAMGEVRARMTRHALNWLKPEVKEIPEGAVFERLVRNKWLCADCDSIADFVQAYKQQAAMMEKWQADGIRLDPHSGILDDYAVFVTDDFDVALKHNFMLAENDEGDAAGQLASTEDMSVH